jgi:2-polyprenyl-6-methoxyphenol hydroxylase-like FAD-dependent oxidoreductase
MTIRVACVGGGPGGLFFSTLLKRARPDIEVVLFERNRPTDAFGFGVVFSDRTLARIDAADPVLHEALAREGVHWDALAVSAKGETHTFAGNGMAAVHRRVLLRFLQGAAADAGVELRFGQDVTRADLGDFDVIVGADGTNSRLRDELEPRLGSSVETAVAKFIWFGTTHLFDGLTFLHRRNEHGNFAAHAYPISGELSTFIVETDEETWRRAGLDRFDPRTPPGASDEVTQAYLTELFRDDIEGAELVGNNSRWANFRTRRTAHWHADNVVLLGDAVHTAHFSVGSGTKMAMEDAIVLAREIAAADAGDLAGAFERYEAERKPEVAKIQDAAGPSLSWWEHFAQYYQALDPLEFAFHFFSRSIDIERVRRRDPQLAAAVDEAWLARHGAAPLQSALKGDGWRLSGRRLTLRESADGLVLADADGGTVTARLLEAPLDEHAVEAVDLDAAAPVVVIGGGTPLTRNLLAERARMRHGLIAVVLDDELDDAAAATLLLSGRADAVASRERAHAAV